MGAPRVAVDPDHAMALGLRGNEVWKDQEAAAGLAWIGISRRIRPLRMRIIDRYVTPDTHLLVLRRGGALCRTGPRKRLQADDAPGRSRGTDGPIVSFIAYICLSRLLSPSVGFLTEVLLVSANVGRKRLIRSGQWRRVPRTFQSSCSGWSAFQSVSGSMSMWRQRLSGGCGRQSSLNPLALFASDKGDHGISSRKIYVGRNQVRTPSISSCTN
jgi:hypothetical protein